MTESFSYSYRLIRFIGRSFFILQRRSRIALFVALIGCTAFFPCNGLTQSGPTGTPGLARADDIAGHWRYTLHSMPLCYLLLLPGIAGFFIVAFARRKKDSPLAGASGIFLVLSAVCLISATGLPENTTSVGSGIDAYGLGRYKEARALFVKSRTRGIERAYLEYDIALCMIAERNVPGALLTLYHALRASPGERILLDAIAEIEKSEGLAHQLDPVPAIDPDVPFAAAIVLFNTGCILFGLFLRTKKGTLFVLAICFAMLFLSAATLAGFYIRERGMQVSIAGAGGAGLKKIPITDFNVQKKIQSGTLLRVFGEANGYVLVETGTGLKGWIKKDEMIAFDE